ncbi:MAG: hypothetical protein P8Q92_08265 [Pseudoprimorskyibacter sp.]|nr:hypothetical protein [Pseudoprimorskyibacter sp.]
MIRSIFLVLCFLPGFALADLPQRMMCNGQNPAWTLRIEDDTAVLNHLIKTQMNLMLSTVAKGQLTPVALTFVGDRDTAIVVVHDRICGTAPYEAQVLTQRGQTPILLTGCCEVTK